MLDYAWKSFSCLPPYDQGCCQLATMPAKCKSLARTMKVQETILLLG